LLLRSNVSDELIGLLAPLQHLRELSLRGCTMLTGRLDTGFSRLLALSSLRWLDISNCESLQVWARMSLCATCSSIADISFIGLLHTPVRPFGRRAQRTETHSSPRRSGAG
jgi:hypothetical protein